MAVEIEVVHLALHTAQLITIGIVLFYFVKMYRATRSSFNFALVIFAVAMVVEVVFALSPENLIFHTVAEVFLLVALVLLLTAVRK